MPFKAELKQLYEFVIQPWAQHQGLECRRADELFGSSPIMADVWKSIQSAEVVIADLTGRNPNVMYELGLSHCLWKKMILITQDAEDVPFDLKGYRLVIYEPSIGGAERLKENLTSTLETLRRDSFSEAQIVPYSQENSFADANDRIEAQVMNVTPERVSLRLSTGDNATLHSDDFSWHYKIRDLRHKFSIGDSARGVLIGHRDGVRRFSVKHQWPDPWPDFVSNHPQGSEFVGTVVAIHHFGAFVQIEDRFNGLLPSNQIGAEELHVGGQVRARVESVDSNNANISLSLIENLGGGLSEGATIEGEVVKCQADYCLVQFEDGKRGMCHISNFDSVEPPDMVESFPVGLKANWRIRSIRQGGSRIDLVPADFGDGEQGSSQEAA